MAKFEKDYADRAALGAALAEGLAALGYDVVYNAASGSSYIVIVKARDGFYIRWSFEWFKYSTKRSRYTEAVQTTCGTEHASGASDVSGLKQTNYCGQHSQYNFSGNRMPSTFPGKLRIVKSDLDESFIWALSNHTDETTWIGCVFSHLRNDNAQIGDSKLWFYEAVGSTNSKTSGRSLCFHTDREYRGQRTGRILITKGGSAFKLAGTCGYDDDTTDDTGYSGVGFYPGENGNYTPIAGLYQEIDNLLFFAPSITTYFVPGLWCFKEPTKDRVAYNFTVNGQFETIKATTMQYMGVGGEVIYNGKKYVVFPTLGKPLTNTPALAFLVGNA
ncbi:hypothetical protein [Vibrio phage vB_VhaS-tm]|nr:hypothetical protein [Vibrio phage vB_VhaS-tm]